MSNRIPVYTPNLTPAETAKVMDCMETGWISSRGKYVEEFEQKFCDYTGVAHATTVSNGTVALHLALLALDIQPGDEIIVPTFTYVASVNAIRYMGAVPVFAESELDYWQLDVADVEHRITPKTKAIMAVHLYGHPTDMTALNAVAKAHNLYVVEDAAEAFGAYHKGEHVGKFGDVATFSFFANKTITTGEGGMVTTQNEDLYKEMALLKTHYVSSTKQYWHDKVGYNYRMTNICAAIGVSQISRADDIIARKKHVAMRYRELLADCPVVFQGIRDDAVHSHWMVSLRVEEGYSRDAFRDFLADHDIETRPAFFEVHTMPMYQEFHLNNERFPVAEQLSAQGLNLPSYPDLTEEDLVRISDVAHQFFKSRKKA
ncbi:DegT/DnrJ/EryC1/StrS family aminotransferase [Litorimonas sp. RW-G-Af-16]|uniref:DegT/DnrJ/EryC1/StrS family aminotransferase n=1 Tax=Litorimonas sp. RW-G-Af-16 TaxID=3241168 RepID=UPI00390C4E13